MASYRNIAPVQVLNQNITSGPVLSKSLDIRSLTKAAFLVNVANGLNATFKVMVSFDNVTFYDSGMSLPAASGSALTFPVEAPGSFPYVAVQVNYGSGGANVTITGSAKGVG